MRVRVLHSSLSLPERITYYTIFLIADGAQLHFGRRAPRVFGRLSGPGRGRGGGRAGLRGGGLRVRVLHKLWLGVLRGQQGLLRADAGEVPAKDHYTDMNGNKY